METRWIACNACGADRFAALSAVGVWTIGRCEACGLVFVNPVPIFEPTDEFSTISREFEYTEYMHGPVTEQILAFERRQLAANAEEVARLADGGRSPASPLRFLDVGCGSGASVRAATDLGWEAIGIDLDPELVRKGREALGADLRCTPILDADLPFGQFDLVKLRDVIEHLPNPQEVLVRVRDLLAPDGVALFVTPNEGGLATQVRIALRLKRKVVATVPPPHHLHSFDPRTLVRTLRRAGLDPRIVTTTTPMDWRYVTSSNMARAQANPLLRPLWRAGRSLGMGAVLVSWVRR